MLKSRVFGKKSILERFLQYIKSKKLHSYGIIVPKGLQILGDMPIIKKPSGGEIIVGENVVLNSDKKKSNSALTTSVKLTTGYKGKIELGRNTILNGSCIVSYDSVKIGDYCEIASCTIISDTDFHPVDPSTRLKQMKGEPFDHDLVNKKPITIGNNCWIGYGSIILKGCTIGNNCVVAAGTIIPGGATFPDNSIIAGNPGKVVKRI